MTNRKSQTRFRLVPKSSTVDDLEWTWTAKTHSFAEKMRLLEPTAQIWMKIDPYCQRQKCRPMILVSGKIRFMGIFAGVPLGGGVKRHCWLSTTTILGDFENFRDTASNIIWRYATPCRPANDCKMNDVEWPWVAIFHDKMCFRPALLESERLNVRYSSTTSAILRCSVHCTIS